MLNEAKRELKFLLVYLHSEDHQDTEKFCRNTLTNPQVINYINEGMLFWGCSVKSPEGYRVSQALRETGYPFLAVIVLRQNRMVVVGRLEGYQQPDRLTTRLTEIVRENEAFIVVARAERHEIDTTRVIRNEQDIIFRDTLKQDQEREKRKKEEGERKKREADEIKRREKEEQEKKDRIIQMKMDLVSQVPDEPPANHAESVRVLIKLPDGQRLERRFLRSHTLKHVYNFVFCHPESPDEFDIVTNFPRKVLDCKEDGAPTLAESGFSRSEMLFVNDLDA